MASTAVAPRQDASKGESGLVKLAAYSAALATAALIAGSERFAAPYFELPGSSLVVWALLATLGAVSTVDLGEGRPALSMDLPILLACAFVEGPAAAGFVALLGTFDKFELRGRTTIVRFLWNHSQTALSVMAAGWVFWLAGGPEQRVEVLVAAGMLAVLADVATNYVLVATLQSLLSGDGFRQTVLKMKVGSARGFMVSYLAFGLLGVTIAVVYDAIGLSGVVICLAPLLLAREAFALALKSERGESRQHAQSLALARVDQRIAAERNDERSQIAAALHDDVLQCLYNVRIRAEVIREDLRTGRLLELEDDVPAVVGAAEQAATEMRDVIQGLRRSAIGQTGLLDTVMLLANHLRDDSGIKFVLNLREITGVTPEYELLGYQIVREAMTNATRHSGADSVWVTIRSEGGWMIVEVIDNGCGFDAQLALSGQSTHFGLTLMQERAAQVGGDVEVRSQRGQGAVIRARLPLK